MKICSFDADEFGLFCVDTDSRGDAFEGGSARAWIQHC